MFFLKICEYETYRREFYSPAVIILSGLSIMNRTAFAYEIHLEQLPEELNNLPDKAHKAKLVAKVVTVFGRLFGCVGFSRLFILVAAAVITEIVTVCILMSKSFDFLFVCFAAVIVTNCPFKACLAAFGSSYYFVLCEGVSESCTFNFSLVCFTADCTGTCLFCIFTARSRRCYFIFI